MDASSVGLHLASLVCLVDGGVRFAFVMSVCSLAAALRASCSVASSTPSRCLAHYRRPARLCIVVICHEGRITISSYVLFISPFSPLVCSSSTDTARLSRKASPTCKDCKNTSCSICQSYPKLAASRAGLACPTACFTAFPLFFFWKREEGWHTARLLFFLSASFHYFSAP